MKTKSYVDPILLVSFIFTAVTGILLFFHIHSFLIMEIHDWAGVLCVLMGLVHLLQNLRPMKAWFRRKSSLIALTLTTLVLGGFALHLIGHTYPPRPNNTPVAQTTPTHP